jgi:hypothetical protein
LLICENGDLEIDVEDYRERGDIALFARREFHGFEN